MEWFFRVFFGVIGLCGVIALGRGVKNLCAPKHSCAAVLQKREQVLFPFSVGGYRKDREDCRLTFFLPGQNKLLTFSVHRAIYDTSRTGAGGELAYRGKHLISWEAKDLSQW